MLIILKKKKEQKQNKITNKKEVVNKSDFEIKGKDKATRKENNKEKMEVV